MRPGKNFPYKQSKNCQKNRDSLTSGFLSQTFGVFRLYQMVEISVKDQGAKNIEMEKFLIKKAGKFVKDYEFFPNFLSQNP